MTRLLSSVKCVRQPTINATHYIYNTFCTLWVLSIDAQKLLTIISSLQTNQIDTKESLCNQLILVTLQFSRKKIGRNSQYFERKLPSLAYLFSCQPNLTSRCFASMITNHTLQLDYHIVVMQSNFNVNQINTSFQAFSSL